MNLVNTTLNGYKFLSIIGQGGQSTVYKAKHIQSQQLFAIKALKTSQQAEQYEDQITQENAYVGLFNHLNVITYYEEFEVNSEKYLIIDYCQGTLFDYLEQNNYKIHEDQVKLIIFQILNGLNYIHQMKIIHRDLNINNILLKDGKWKIADFGFSIQSEKPQNLTLGTAGYIAPEMFTSDYDRKVDIFSLGCLFYQLKYGRLPFPSQNLNEYQKILFSGQEPQYDDDIDFQLFDLVYQMLRLNPQERIEIQDILQLEMFENLQQHHFTIKRSFNFDEFDKELIPDEQYSRIRQKQYLPQRTTNIQIKKQIQTIKYLLEVTKIQNSQFKRELSYINILIIDDLLFKVKKQSIYYPQVRELQLEQNLIFLQLNPNIEINLKHLRQIVGFKDLSEQKNLYQEKKQNNNGVDENLQRILNNYLYIYDSI